MVGTEERATESLHERGPPFQNLSQRVNPAAFAVVCLSVRPTHTHRQGSCCRSPPVASTEIFSPCYESCFPASLHTEYCGGDIESEFCWPPLESGVPGVHRWLGW